MWSIGETQINKRERLVVLGTWRSRDLGDALQARLVNVAEAH
jgi:hypothetical protein